MNLFISASVCSKSYVVQECEKLKNSIVSFREFPHEKQIRLALSEELGVPLRLTLEGGSCPISCEGEYLPTCNTSKQNYIWQHVSTPFYFDNCSALQYYCAYITIPEEDSECCPSCTETVFMKDYKYQPAFEKIMPWNNLVAAVILLLLLLVVAIFFIKYFITGILVKKHSKFYTTGHIPVSIRSNSSDLLEKGDKTILCLYIKGKTDNKIIEQVSFLQEYLRSKGLKVIDVYDEEWDINTSLLNWIQNIRRQNIKTLIVATDLMWCLLHSQVVSYQVTCPVERAVLYYLQTCLHNSFAEVYIVRYQEQSSKQFLEFGNGKSYNYPANCKRLVEDLLLDN